MAILNKVDRVMNSVYQIFGILSGVLIVLITLAVAISIFSRMLGIYVPGIVEISGYMLAGSGALGLSYTFQKNGHIRALMFVEKLKGKSRYALELWALLFATGMMSYLAFYLGKMTYISWLFEEISDGSDEVHIWIPQLIMSIGFILFAMCLTHALIKAVFTKKFFYSSVSADLDDLDKGIK